MSVNSYNFLEADTEWLYYIALNRRRELCDVLTKHIPNKVFDAEIISGKIANDTTNPVLTAFLSGLYGPVDTIQAANTAIGLLLPDRLKDQFCFKSERAISLLKFEGSERYEF